MNVSTYLRTHLDEHGWTPSELARRAGVSRQYVNGLLNGSTGAIRLPCSTPGSNRTMWAVRGGLLVLQERMAA